jgi:type III restriction enzyme
MRCIWWKPRRSSCERINALPPQHRSDLPWHYVLLGEAVFQDWRNKGARLAELLAFARVRPVASPLVQGKLDL